MKLTGKVTSVTPTQTGESARGEWKKAGFMITYKDGEFEKSAYFTGFNRPVELIEKLQIGQSVEVSFNIESREYNGKFYTDLNAWRIDVLDTVAGTQPDATSVDPLPF